MKTQKKKCNCGAENKITCPNCSDFKMVILLKNGNNHLKLKGHNGKMNNPVWYNHLSKNTKDINLIANSMYKRFQKSIYANSANFLHFYSNTSGKLLMKVNCA